MSHDDTAAGPPAAEPDAAEPDAAEPDPRRRRRLDWRAPVLVAPTLIALGAIIGYPIVRAIMLSFEAGRHENEFGRLISGGFAGLENYLYWLGQRCTKLTGEMTACAPGTLAADFWPALRITLFFTVVTVLIEIILGLWMALVMGRTFLGRSLLRAAVLVPWAIPTAVTAKLWQFMFSGNGVVNSVLGADIDWVRDPWAARFSIILADVWKTTPFMALLILAGLQMIPNDVYEAARVDGATAWQRFTRITLPLVKPALAVAILFRTLDALRMYDLPVIMIGEATDSPTAVISQLVVSGIRAGQYEQASALSTLIFLFIFAVAYLLVRVLGANVVSTQEEYTKGDRR